MAKTPKKKRKRQAPATPAVVEHDLFDNTGVFERQDYRNLWIVVSLALVIRVIFFVLYRENNPLFYHPIMDAKYHHEWALEILSGNFWGDAVFFRAPLYPYFLALLYKVSGESIAFAIFFQHLIGTGTAVIVYLLARQFFTSRVALTAGVLAALYWPFIYFEGDLLIVTLIVCLDVLALFFLTKAMRNGARRWLFAAGLVLGLSAIARPNILILLPVLPLVFFLHSRGRNTHRWWSRTLVVYVAASIPIVPVIVRNYVVGRDIVPIASQGGVNFYIGNNPQSDGRTAIVPGTRWDWWGGYEDAIAMAEQSRGRSLKPSEVSSYYFGRGFGFVFGSPDQSLPLLARKAGLFWAGGERSNNKYIYFFWHKSGLGKIPLPGFWLIAPLGFAGVFLLWRRRRDYSLLFLFVLSYMVGVVAFFVNARFRLPIVPVLIILAAYAIVFLWSAVRRRDAGLWKVVVVVLLCFALIDADFVNFKENKVHADSLSHYTLGNAYLKRDLPDRAIDEYETALEVYSRYPTSGFRIVARNVDFNLGKLYHDKGLCSRASPHLERVGGSDQFTYIASEYLGNCYLSLGRYAEAARTYRQLLDAQPDHANALQGLHAAMLGEARLYESEGNSGRALRVLSEAQRLFPNDSAIPAEIERIRGGQ